MKPAKPGGRRKSDRMACKQCPACEDQVPVACKYCPCGHQFPTRNKAKQKLQQQKSNREEKGKDGEDSPSTETIASTSVTTSAVVAAESFEFGVKRRTVRTKRYRPEFYNSREQDESSRRKPKEGSDKGSPDKAKRRRSRAKSENNIKEETVISVPAQVPPPSPPEEDLFVDLPAEKALQYSVILAELNRKLTTQHFHPL